MYSIKLKSKQVIRPQFSPLSTKKIIHTKLKNFIVILLLKRVLHHTERDSKMGFGLVRKLSQIEDLAQGKT